MAHAQQWWVAAAVLCSVAGIAGAVQPAHQGEEPPQQPDAPAEGGAVNIAPEARAVLDRVRAFYPKLAGVKVTARIAEKENEEAEEQTASMTIVAEDPNKVAVKTDGEAEIGYQFVSDGRTLYQYVGERFNMYSEEEAPGTYADLLVASMLGEAPDAVTLAMNPPALILSLLSDEPLEPLLSEAQEITYTGREEIEGRPHHKLRIVGAANTDFPAPHLSIWVADGEQPWIGRIAPDFTPIVEKRREMGMPESEPPVIELRFTDWQEQSGSPEGTFAFKPPEDAEKVDSLLEAMMAGAGGEEPGSALLGSPAPALKADLLGGGAATLDAHKGKDIVVLDFWATWCPPCVVGLPIVSKVTDKYKDRNVVFYAVNVQEDEQTIRDFLKKRELAGFKVALDASGETSQRYGVSGIPQTVIIDKQGVVQAVHVGLLPDMEEQLTKELETLLKGEPLVKADEPADDDGEP